MFFRVGRKGSLSGALLFSAIAGGLVFPASSREVDVTRGVERLGIPLERRYREGEWVYARNVWDLQAFESRLFIGSGNSNNRSPAPNASPVEVWGFDPRKGKFFSEGTLDECQLDLFRVFDGRLFVPGHDATESWELGNFYLRGDGGDWSKRRTIPGAIHVYDLLHFRGGLFAAIGANRSVRRSQAIMGSADDGKTWKPLVDAKGRIYSLFTLNGDLFGASYRRLFQLFGRKFEPVPVSRFSKGRVFGRVVRPVNFEGRLVYLLSRGTSDHQWSPLEGLVAEDVDQGKEMIPVLGKPYDLLVRDGLCFVLACEELGPQRESRTKPSKDAPRARIRVYASSDLRRWDPLFRFDAGTFARSFEEIAGDYYFGMGCEIDELRPDCGAILRVPRAAAEPGLSVVLAREEKEITELLVEKESLRKPIERAWSEGTDFFAAGKMSQAVRSLKRVRSLARAALGSRNSDRLSLSMDRAFLVRGTHELVVELESSKRARRGVEASLTVYDAAGTRVRGLEAEEKGQTRFRWDGKGGSGNPVPAGEYTLIGRVEVDGRSSFPVRSRVWVRAQP